MSDLDPEYEPRSTVDLSHHLAKLDPRPDTVTPLEVSAPSRSLLLDRGEDLTAVAVALLVLERVSSHNGSRVPLRVIRPLRERATLPFTPAAVMAMEVEAYNTLSWVASLEPEKVRKQSPVEPTPATKAGDTIRYDPKTPPIDLLRRAISEEFDVEIVYYTQSRGQLNKRRISPLTIEAETYLHAYCHTRRAERVFKISRIAEVRPVDGRAVAARKPKAPREGTDQGELEF